jgi:ABC-type transport system substrate-binding protein
MIANDSEDVIDFCWEWQNYMLDKILPCLPMFVQKNNSEYFQVLFYNLKETHPVIGNRDSSPGNVEFTKGLAIRKAITYAINREEIRRVVLGDDYKVINDPINPFMGNWCNPNVVRYCHDLYVARRFFELAGYSLCGGWYTGKYTDPFPNFTDWEAVCSRNEPITPTIDVQGFTFVSSCLAVNSITMISMIFLVKRRKNI